MFNMLRRFIDLDIAKETTAIRELLTANCNRQPCFGCGLGRRNDDFAG